MAYVHPNSSTYAESLADPDSFWLRAAENVSWDVKPRVARVGPDDQPVWFPDGKLNTAYNAIDRHVENGNGARVALIYDSPVTGVIRRITYLELKQEVARLAGALRRVGVGLGDRVVIYMPMVPEAVFAMLACARLGAVHCVAFGGFAAHELAVRIDDAKPKVVLSASCGIEGNRIVPYAPRLYDAIDIAKHKPEHRVILQREAVLAELRPNDTSWSDFIDGAEEAECVVTASSDPLYILYTSGTTGNPKGVVKTVGGHAVSITWSMSAVYDTHPGQVFWAASDLGWVVGHSYIVYGPLFIGGTTVVYEGKPVGTPDASAFWRVLSQHAVRTMLVAPTTLRVIRQADPTAELRQPFNLDSLRGLFVSGERLDRDTFAWISSLTKASIVDHWAQTETWPMGANALGIGEVQPKPGSITRPVPGYDIRVLDDDGNELPPGAEGHIAIKLPLPPGCATTLWGNRAGYEKAYLEQFAGFYSIGDGGYFDDEGYLFITGRTDDVINVAGHRLSTGAIEEAIIAHADVAEVAVIGVSDNIKGQLPLALVVRQNHAVRETSQLASDLNDAVRRSIGAIASLKNVIVVDRLPKTRSGKILRATMRSIADGRPFAIPATIENPDVLDEVALILRGHSS